MRSLEYRNSTLYMDNFPLSHISSQFGTPTYVYSARGILENLNAYKEGLATHPHQICFAVKANSNLHILRLLAEHGCGFEVVSGGELTRVIQAGGSSSRIIFTGVGKTSAEILLGLSSDIFCFTVESVEELERIAQLAQEQQTIARVALRINPDIDSESHPHISTGKAGHKFGMSIPQALQILPRFQTWPSIKLIGMACHIGSQITAPHAFEQALDILLTFLATLEQQGISISFLNMGGGLGIDYASSRSPDIIKHTKLLTNAMAGSRYELIIEPGRSLVANAGILLSRVEYIKKTAQKNFVILDAGMNDLMRPALYDGWHDIWPIQQDDSLDPIFCDVVGPVCETTDVLGAGRQLKIRPNEEVALLNCGAYGFTMSSNYNSRPRAAEVLIIDDEAKLIRKRESYHDLFAGEL